MVFSDNSQSVVVWTHQLCVLCVRMTVDRIIICVPLLSPQTNLPGRLLLLSGWDARLHFHPQPGLPVGGVRHCWSFRVSCWPSQADCPACETQGTVLYEQTCFAELPCAWSYQSNGLLWRRVCSDSGLLVTVGKDFKMRIRTLTLTMEHSH